MTHDLLIIFYGDDFTGSTDALECLQINGIPSVLFLELPTPEMLEKFPEARGVGVAGISRTLSPEQMDAELPEKFNALKAFNAPYFHYKVCSTFDSSPAVGSIGRAIDIGWEIFNPPMVPLVIGAPFLRRYVVFGNLFARVDDTTYRLDRHPTMSKHPITPMTESDLRVHLGKQTGKSIGLIDTWHMASKTEAALDAYLQQLRDEGHQIILFDTLDENHMMQIGRILWGLQGEQTVFLAGSSGIEFLLGMYLMAQGIVDRPEPFQSPGRAERLLVMSGSCAPPTAEQIVYLLDRGFAGIRLDAPRLIDPATQEAERAAVVAEALKLFAAGGNVVLYSALGPDDPAITATKAHMAAIGMNPQQVGHKLGAQQGLIVREVLEATDIRRVVVCGGDTCGYASQQLGIYALQMVYPITPGAPLCRASSDNPRFDGLEITLKGGQNGAADYLARVYYGLQAFEDVPET